MFSRSQLIAVVLTCGWLQSGFAADPIEDGFRKVKSNSEFSESLLPSVAFKSASLDPLLVVGEWERIRADLEKVLSDNSLENEDLTLKFRKLIADEESTLTVVLTEPRNEKVKQALTSVFGLQDRNFSRLQKGFVTRALKVDDLKDQFKAGGSLAYAEIKAASIEEIQSGQNAIQAYLRKIGKSGDIACRDNRHTDEWCEAVSSWVFIGETELPKRRENAWRLFFSVRSIEGQYQMVTAIEFGYRTPGGDYKVGSSIGKPASFGGSDLAIRLNSSSLRTEEYHKEPNDADNTTILSTVAAISSQEEGLAVLTKEFQKAMIERLCKGE